MNRDWETIFNTWAKPPGTTEQQRCDNAERAIRNAIAASDKLKNRNIKVFAHGSYRNNVNVRKDSDVDIGILCYDTFHPTYPEGIDAKALGHSDATYAYATFKDEIEEALVRHFGRDAVRRGNKAFDVHETSYHVEADVAPFFEHRRYVDRTHYLSGVILFPDNGGRVINWPEQHYENGIKKNSATGRRSKGIVRILKSLKNEMEDVGVPEVLPIPGFLVECLVWNVPNSCFGHDTWDQDVQAALLHLWSNTKDDQKCSEWGEVSDLKYLFRGSPTSKREQAHAFIDTAWSYVGVR